MARKKKEEAAAPGAPAWMATFGDLMNLLLCFFIVLFAFSSVDAEKYEEIATSFSNSFSIFDSGGTSVILDGQLISSGVSQLNELDEYFNDMGKNNESDNSEELDGLEAYEQQQKEQQQAATESLYDEISSEVNLKQLEDLIDLDMDKNYQYVRISLNGAILFDSGKADVKKEAIPILSKVGDILKIYDGFLIKVEGHTDNEPITNNVYKSNMWLSTARATTVFEYFINKKALDPDTIEASGRSEYDPIADNNTPEGRAKNRRVEIKIYTDTK